MYRAAKDVFRIREEQGRCFVTLSNGTQRQYPTATAIRGTQDGGIEIYNERIFLASFKKGEFRNCWIAPRILVSQRKRGERVTKRKRH